MWLPVFSGDTVPLQIRLALAAMIALFVFPTLEDIAVVPVANLYLVIYCFKELMVGVMMGIAVRTVFYAVEFGGHVISQESSLAMSAAFDPNSGTQSTPIGSLMFNLAIVIFLASGFHYEVFAALIRSYQVMPVGILFPGAGGMQELVEDTGYVFVLGLQMAAPILAINFVINLTFAVLGKAAPKFNVFITSFSVRIFASLILLTLTVGLIVQYIHGAMQRSPEQMLRYMMP